jgi:hypothetical protein
VTRTRKEPSEEEVGVAKTEVEQGGMCPWQRRKAEVRSRSAQAGGGWGSPAKVSAVELYAGEGKVAMGPPLASGYGWSDLATFAWSNSNQQGHNEVKSYPRGVKGEDGNSRGAIASLLQYFCSSVHILFCVTSHANKTHTSLRHSRGVVSLAR